MVLQNDDNGGDWIWFAPLRNICHICEAILNSIDGIKKGGRHSNSEIR